MKKNAKKVIRFLSLELFKIYLELYYKRQIKNKFLNEKDCLDEKYKQDIRCYWSKFDKKICDDWHKWYSARNGIEDVRYIPEYIFYCFIEPFYNRLDFAKAYEDKAFYNMWFPNVKRPTTIAKNISGIYYDDELNIITQEDVIKRCLLEGRIIIKPCIDSGGGRNICFIDNKAVDDTRKAVIRNMIELKNNYIIQKIIEQDDKLKQVNAESVNTIRVISFLFKNRVHILSSILRMGINASKVDNETSGGISCGILNNGRLRKYAFDRYGVKFAVHPQGFIFENSIVPHYSEVVNIIKREHLKFGHFKIISWDFAIDSEGSPVLIEYNLRFQGLNFHQMDNGPLFSDLTDEVLEEVFGRRKCN